MGKERHMSSLSWAEKKNLSQWNEYWLFPKVLNIVKDIIGSKLQRMRLENEVGKLRFFAVVYQVVITAIYSVHQWER